MTWGLTTGSAGSELMRGSPDFNSCCFGYLQGPNPLVPRDPKFGVIPALPSSGGAGGEGVLAGKVCLLFINLWCPGPLSTGHGSISELQIAMCCPAWSNRF